MVVSGRTRSDEVVAKGITYRRMKPSDEARLHRIGTSTKSRGGGGPRKAYEIDSALHIQKKSQVSETGHGWMIMHSLPWLWDL